MKFDQYNVWKGPTAANLLHIRQRSGTCVVESRGAYIQRSRSVYHIIFDVTRHWGKSRWRDLWNRSVRQTRILKKAKVMSVRCIGKQLKYCCGTHLIPITVSCVALSANPTRTSKFTQSKRVTTTWRVGISFSGEFDRAGKKQVNTVLWFLPNDVIIYWDSLGHTKA